MTDNEDRAYDVEFMSCVVNKKNNYEITDSDSHFSEFTGMHISKIHQGKMKLWDIIKPSDRQAVQKKIDRPDSPYVYLEFYIKNATGDYVYLHCAAQNYENGSLCRLVFADVSKSVKETIAIRRRADEIDNLINIVNSGVALFKVTPDMHLILLYINAACARLFSSDVSGDMGAMEFDPSGDVYPEDRSVVFRAIGEALSGDESSNFEFRIIQKNKKCRWIKCTLSYYRDDDDKNPIFHAALTNISYQKKAEEKANAATEKLKTVIENLDGAVLITHANEPFKLYLASRDFIKMTGYTRAELAGNFDNNIENLMPRDRELVESLKRSIKTQSSKGGKAVINYRLGVKGAESVTVRDSRRLISQSDGTKMYICRIDKMIKL